MQLTGSEKLVFIISFMAMMNWGSSYCTKYVQYFFIFLDRLLI